MPFSPTMMYNLKRSGRLYKPHLTYAENPCACLAGQVEEMDGNYLVRTFLFPVE